MTELKAECSPLMADGSFHCVEVNLDCGGIHPNQRWVKDMHLWPEGDTAKLECWSRRGLRSRRV
ncbi:hypothetical protein T4E_2736 [Trichinella pseudospiralis]|uniref:Uncharacterized protein n=1 Tax=Trichinella pseudospiralis TaxID=6337 RepID=A0A0V0XUU5_TRIPS|nr:hypothetical protein T4E_2736 [Trichinella pseudospiralis]